MLQKVNLRHFYLPLCRSPGVSQQSAWLGHGSPVQCEHSQDSSMHDPPRSCIKNTCTCIGSYLNIFCMNSSLCSEWVCVCVPVIEVLGYDEVFEVVVYGSLIILEKRVGVAQTVAGLGLHSSILQLSRQLQRLPDKHTQTCWFKILRRGFTFAEEAHSRNKSFFKSSKKHYSLIYV